MAVTINGDGSITPKSSVQPSGSILQIVSTNSKAVEFTNSSSYQHVSNFDTTITPQASNSTLIISWIGSTCRAYDNNGEEGFADFALTKDDGSNWLCENYHRCKTWNNDGSLRDTTHAIQFVESAGNTNARTYEIWMKKTAGDAVEINPANNSNNASMVIMEVAA